MNLNLTPDELDVLMSALMSCESFKESMDDLAFDIYHQWGLSPRVGKDRLIETIDSAYTKLKEARTNGYKSLRLRERQRI